MLLVPSFFVCKLFCFNYQRPSFHTSFSSLVSCGFVGSAGVSDAMSSTSFSRSVLLSHISGLIYFAFILLSDILLVNEFLVEVPARVCCSGRHLFFNHVFYLIITLRVVPSVMRMMFTPFSMRLSLAPAAL